MALGSKSIAIRIRCWTQKIAAGSAMESARSLEEEMIGKAAHGALLRLIHLIERPCKVRLTYRPGVTLLR